jgi:hypothetical protein
MMFEFCRLSNDLVQDARSALRRFGLLRFDWA